MIAFTFVSVVAFCSSLISAANLRDQRLGPDALIEQTLANINEHFVQLKGSSINTESTPTKKRGITSEDVFKPMTILEHLTDATEEYVASTTGNTGYIGGYFYKLVYSGLDCPANISYQAVAFTIGECFPSTLFTSDDAPEYLSAMVVKVTPPNPDKANPQYMLKIALFSDRACSQNRVVFKQKAPGGCVNDPTSSYMFGWLATLPTLAPTGVWYRSYNTEADCVQGKNFYSTTYIPANTCNYGSIFVDDDSLAQYPFNVVGCSSQSIGATTGTNVQVYGYDSNDQCMGTPSSVNIYQPACQYNGGYVGSVSCTGTGNHGSFTPPPTAAPTWAPGSPTAAPTVFGTSSSTVINSGYVAANAFAANTACTGAPSVSAIQLGYCYATGGGSLMYSNYVAKSSTDSVVYTKYSDAACTTQTSTQTLVYSSGSCTGNVEYTYSMTVPSYGPGMMINTYDSFASCSMGINPVLFQFLPVNACVGSSVVNACTAVKFAYTSFAYPNCTTFDSTTYYPIATCTLYNGLYYSFTCTGGIVM